jgi:Na+-driven multidrug efflux pump
MTAASMTARTRLLLEGPIAETLLRLAAPNLVVNVILIAVTTGVDAHFVGRLGPEALAGLALVFPLLMLMQQMANFSMGGALARALGAGRRDEANALAVHGIVIACAAALLFSVALLLAGPAVYRLLGGEGSTLAAAVEYSNVIFAGALGAAALAGVGAAVRLEYVMYPVVFGLGAAVVAMVGTNVGASKTQRANRIAWTAAAMAMGATPLIGLLAFVWPHGWAALFTTEPDVIESAALYPVIVAAGYPFIGMNTLTQAFQALGKTLWPLIAVIARTVIIIVGGWLVMAFTGSGVAGLAAVTALSLIVAGAIVAIAFRFTQQGEPS